MSQTLTLSNIRSSLIRQEDTIIFQLIERAQYARNSPVYVSEGVPVPGGPRCWRGPACGVWYGVGAAGCRRWWQPERPTRRLFLPQRGLTPQS
jgi:hypothetical protein